MGNTPRVSCRRRIPAEWSPRAVNDMDLEFLGSAHGVPTNMLCLRCWAMPARESNSLLQLAHLKPNDSGNCFGPSGFPLPAPRSMLCEWRSTYSNFLSVALSMPMSPKLELNTTHTQNVQPCALRLMDQRHECARFTANFTFWLINSQNVRRLPLKSMRII